MLLWIIIGILLLNWTFEQYLAWLNLRHHKRELPPGLEARFDAEKYAKSYDYHQVNYRFSLIQSVLSLALLTLILLGGGFGWLDEQLQPGFPSPIWRALVFFGVLYLVSDWMSLPFQWYRTFHIEARFGFNQTTPRTFIIDKLKSYLLTLIIGGLVLGVLLALILWLKGNFWFWFWLFISGFMLLVNVFYTAWLLPLFNRLTPLEDGSLRQAIEQYSEQVKFPLTNILVMDGSRRSAKANAFFSGLGKRKKVVLYDTLIDKHDEDELVAVLAHEVGHYKKKHIQQSLVLSVLQTGLMLFILSFFVFSESLSEALGAQSAQVHLNLIAFGLLYSPLSTLIGIFMNLFSRKNEFEADHFAATTYGAEPLKEALIRLHADNLSNLTPHPFYVFINYSHPPLMQRIAALQAART